MKIKTAKTIALAAMSADVKVIENFKSPLLSDKRSDAAVCASDVKDLYQSIGKIRITKISIYFSTDQEKKEFWEDIDQGFNSVKQNGKYFWF